MAHVPRLPLCKIDHKTVLEHSNCESCMRIAAYESFKHAKVTVNGSPWIHPENRTND